jgi:hypothetical protein
MTHTDRQLCATAAARSDGGADRQAVAMAATVGHSMGCGTSLDDGEGYGVGDAWEGAADAR